MARYRAKTDGFVNGERVRTGQEFTWNGKPGKWMEPLKEAKPEGRGKGSPQKPEGKDDKGKEPKGKEPEGEGAEEGAGGGDGLV